MAWHAMPKMTIPQKFLQSKWLISTNKEDEESSLVRITPQTGGLSLESSNNYEWIDKKSSGPKGSRTPDPRHVKALENEDVQKFEIEQMHNLSSYSSGGGVAREFKSCPPSPLSAENSTVC